MVLNQTTTRKTEFYNCTAWKATYMYLKGALDNILKFSFLAKYHLSGKIWLLIYKYKEKN